MKFKKTIGAILYAALYAVTPAAAQMVETHVTASNGVIIDVNTDDFAARQEFTAPLIKIKVPGAFVDSFGLVALIKKAGVNGKLAVQGSIIYNGDWRFYSSALFKGGDAAPYLSGAREVVSCRGGCSFSEGYSIPLTTSDISKHAENGVLAIQIRPKASSDPIMLEIPTNYIDAVNEVAHVQPEIARIPAAPSDGTPSSPKLHKSAKAAVPKPIAPKK